MSTFRAFQTGLEAGQQQAKVKREDDARVKAAEAFGAGNYEGAVSSLMGVGLMQDASAYGQAGERKKEADRTKAYGDAFRTGLQAGPEPSKKAGYQAVSQAAAQQGDFGTMAEIDQAIAGMDEQQASQFASGMEFLGNTALGLKGVPPESRGQAAMEILKNSPYANPQILAQIQHAAADGKITDDELDNFAMQTMSVAERVKAAKGTYSTANTTDGVIAYNTSDPTDKVTLGGTPAGTAGAPGGRVQSTFVDSNGILNLVMGDGTVTNTGTRARDSLMNVDVGGVPNIGSRYTGGFTPMATPDQVGANKGAIAGGEQLGKTQAEAIKTAPEAISTADRAIASIDELLNSKGFDGAYGLNRALPQNMLPGSDAKNAAAIRSKLDGQFFVTAVTAMQVSLAPVSDADALRLVASVSQLTNPEISPEEARRVAGELKQYFQLAKTKAAEAAKRGPIKNVPELPATSAAPNGPSWSERQAQKAVGMAKPASSPAPATGLEGMTLEQLEALAAQLEGQ